MHVPATEWRTRHGGDDGEVHGFIDVLVVRDSTCKKRGRFRGLFYNPSRLTN